jgi:hypothetical protein
MQRIDFIGSGVMLFRREHLETLARPWFFEEIDHATQNRTACMDTRFCWRLMPKRTPKSGSTRRFPCAICTPSRSIRRPAAGVL